MGKRSGVWKKGREAIALHQARKRIFLARDSPLSCGIIVVTRRAAGKFPRPDIIMNARTSLRKPQAAAFTLIELLTVIAIIAILMGLLFPVIGSAKDNARRASAAAAVRNIVNACKNYYGDYGKFPPYTAALGGNSSFYSYGDIAAGSCTVTNENLFDILRAISRNANNNNAMNTRQVKYFEMKIASDVNNPRDGFIDGSQFVSGTPGQLMDPWGAQYCVVLDASETGTIDMSSFFSDLAGLQNVVRYSAAAFSMGKDNKRGGTGYQGQLRKPGSTLAPDDIVSWQ
jgi:prepilin-type N-terminal cleavage/methylation domain-containing protein